MRKTKRKARDEKEDVCRSTVFVQTEEIIIDIFHINNNSQALSLSLSIFSL